MCSNTCVDVWDYLITEEVEYTMDGTSQTYLLPCVLDGKMFAKIIDAMGGSIGRIGGGRVGMLYRATIYNGGNMIKVTSQEHIHKCNDIAAGFISLLFARYNLLPL